MNENSDFDRLVADQFAQVSGGVPPARSVDDILIEARRMRPLPRWLATIKEPPMRISSRVAVGSPMARVAFLVILVMILSALTAGSVVVGASLLASPAPPAIAGNGLIAYDAGGDIWVVNPDGTHPRQLDQRRYGRARRDLVARRCPDRLLDSGSCHGARHPGHRGCQRIPSQDDRNARAGMGL